MKKIALAHHLHPVLALAALAVFTGTAALPAYERWKTGSLMAEAARNFLASLDPVQRVFAMVPFDDPNRKDWHYIPRERRGLTFKKMNAAQAQLAHGLLATGLSRRAYLEANTIMSLDQVLREIQTASSPIRDSELYYFTIFGDPVASGRWGWRVEGHHLSVNFVVNKGEVTASTPAFFGANPAEVLSGPRKGLRTMADEEDLGRELMLALDAKQRARALIAAEAPGDIVTDPTKLARDIGAPAGIPYAAMSLKQRQAFDLLLELYITRSPEDVAAERRKELRAALEKIHFAWAGSLERRKPHYYRIQGATFLVEYDDFQNDGNHIHTVWRDLRGDFGPDLLAEHYRRVPHAPRGE